MRRSFGALNSVGAVLVVVLVAMQAGIRCGGAGGAVSTGAGLAEVVCALVLDEQGVEREICDTGAKLAELLARLMAENTLPAPAASGAPTSSASAMASALRRASASAAVERKPVRILNLYVKRSAK